MTETKVMLITGAARRLGADMVKFFHGQGYNIILHYHKSKVEAEVLAAKLNERRSASVRLVTADLAKAVDFDAGLEDALSEWGRLDVLINNASSFYPTRLGEITAEKCYDLLASNTVAPLLLSHEALPYVSKRKGTVVSLIGIPGSMPLRDYAACSMAKAGLKML